MNTLRAPMRTGFPHEPGRYVEARCSEVVLEALQSFCRLKWDRLVDVTIGVWLKRKRLVGKCISVIWRENIISYRHNTAINWKER